MEYADCHAVYVDNRVSRDLDGKLLQKSLDNLHDRNVHEGLSDDENSECLESILGEIEEVRSNLESLLSVFNGGVYCLPPSQWKT